ncbi:hypothetical protein ACYOEI_07610 [Singulisphaera rosea]
MADSALIYVGILVSVAYLLAKYFEHASGRKRSATTQVRRGVGNALLGLQGFVEPSVEYIVQAQNVEQKDEEGDDGDGGDEAEIRSDLGTALERTPVDLEEVRRHLAAASRLGLEWKAVFEDAVAAEVQKCPYRSPSMPPVWRVAPRE